MTRTGASSDGFPADRYLKTRTPESWDMIDFLKSFNPEVDTDVRLDQRRHSWKEALLRVVAAADESSNDRKEKAQHLLGIYEHEDKRRFRDWRANLNRRAQPASISITHSKKFSVNVNTPGESSNRALLGESAGSVRGGVKPRKSGNLKGKTSKRANTGEAESKESTRAKRTKVNRGDDLTLKRLSLFKQRLADIDNASRWYFDDASVAVEDRLAEYVYNNNESETPAHSFVLDTGDPDVEKLFTPEEWIKIKKQLPQPPDPDTVLKDYLDFFRNKKTVDEIYDILERGAYFTVADEGLDGSAKRQKINDYKSGHISLTDNREKWYQGHVWTALFDRALETIPDLRIISGECPTDAAAIRKNPSKALPGTRKAPGRFHDAVIKYTQFELGAVENGKEYTTPTATKWTEDIMKLVKVSRDMIVRLYSRFGKDTNKLPVLGIVTGALHFKTYFTVYGGGTVCILGANPRKLELPTKIQHFGPFAAAMMHVWDVVTIMRECTDTLTQLQNCLDEGPPLELIGSIETDPPTPPEDDQNVDLEPE
ncbi:uncharacterized protein H6S33_006913 [Morchella sextelata]|uniref:uncharacterized protein n=1 Tax=Morchella sextelata TaxID=1174677 RepID=UPI001D04ABEC|nr:uncharacterized protein H6S33_006913 [Morchella sextelata]KAH0604536.1 hypothetical protein H6S33_006913 [Morchella sextelata]